MDSVCDSSQLAYEYKYIYNMKLLSIGNIEFAPGMKIDSRYHKYREIVYTYSGEGIMIAAGINHNVQRGDIFIIKSGINYSIESSFHNTLRIVTFGLDYYLLNGENDDQVGDVNKVEKLSLNNNTQLFEKMIDNLIKQTKSFKPEASFIIESQCMDILVFLLGESYNNPSKESEFNYPAQHDFTKDMLKYIQNNYNNRDICLGNIAENVFHSTYYICHVFKELTGLSPMQYVNSLRIEEGKKMLKSTVLSIGDIAYAIGYNDVHYFSNVFKRSVGCSPSEYRERYNDHILITVK